MSQFQLATRIQWFLLQLILSFVFLIELSQATIPVTSKPAVAHSSQLNQLTQGQQSVQTNEILEDFPVADWNNIQQQINTTTYRAYPNPNGGYDADNPAHGWLIHYGVDGTTHLSPRDTGSSVYQISMRLTAIGYDKLQPLGQPQQISTNDSTVTYQWNDNLKEWWINTPGQLEQWFSLAQRPAGSNESDASSGSSLILQLDLDSVLPISQSGDSLLLTQANGNTITYSKFKVWDATGRNLPAHMQLTNQQLKLIIDDSSARYPLMIDPSFQQQAYLKASNGEGRDQFGFSVAFFGDTVVVGAPGEASNATKINGDQSDNTMFRTGAAYVFIRNGSTWSQQAYLKASNAEDFDQFGHSVAIDGDTIVIGAPAEDSPIRSFIDPQSDNSSPNSGAAYVFSRTGNSWSQQAYLKASNVWSGSQFGISVAIVGDTVVIGSIGENRTVDEYNEDEEHIFADAGAAYVFIRNEASWSQQARLKASNTERGDRFGQSVAIDNNTVVVGANHEQSASREINGDQDNNDADSAGAAYVFTRSGSKWSQQAYLKASNADKFDQFGISVAIAGNTVVVGADGESSSATGVNGNQNNNEILESGAAYIFKRSGKTWNQQAYLKPSNSHTFGQFGHSVAIAGNAVLIGAFGERSNAGVVNNEQTNIKAEFSGAAYVFTRSASTWSQQAYLKAFNAEANDQFGKSVAIDGDSMVIGARFEDSATGINGNQSNNDADNAGATYAFTVEGVNAKVLDIDGNGEQDALSDGILVMRYLLGLSGNALTADAVASNCKRCSNAEIESYLGDLSIYDVDANGSSNAFSDGLLILRYLFGLTGDALINNAVGSNCSRCSNNEIEDYLGEL